MLIMFFHILPHFDLFQGYLKKVPDPYALFSESKNKYEPQKTMTSF